MGRCPRHHRAGGRRHRRHDDVDAQSLARGQDHRDIGAAAPAVAGSEERRIAANDAGRFVGGAGLLFHWRDHRAVRADHGDRAAVGLCHHRLCGAAYADAGAEGPRVLALLHLCLCHGVRLAGAGDGGAGPRRRRVRISPTLSARSAAAFARSVKTPPHPLKPDPHHFNRRTNMEVILLERVVKLGQMGEVVKVRDGFARNFLLKRGKALRATADNRAKYDGMKADLEANNIQAKGEATKVAEKINGRNVVVLRQASETGQLFGSVSVRDIIASFEADGVTISRSQVLLDAPIKTIGKHKIAIAVHPEVEVSVSVTVARSADEAERINRGEDISTRQEDQDAAAEALAAAGEFFDPEAQRDDLEPKAEPASEK